MLLSQGAERERERDWERESVSTAVLVGGRSGGGGEATVEAEQL